MASIFKGKYTDKKTGKTRATRTFYGEYADADGRTRRVPLKTRDKTVARYKVNKLELDARRRRDGLTSAVDEHLAAPLASHVDAFEQFVREGGASAKHAAVTAGRVRAVVAGCGFAFARDVDPVRVRAWVARLRVGRTNPRPASQQTRNYYVREAKAFTRWLLENGRADRDPLAGLGGQAVTERVHARRDLLPEELARLLDAALASPRPAARLSGRDRWALYLTALCTGFRAGELASLTPESFDLGDEPAVTCAAAYTKNRKTAVQEIAAGDAAALRAYLAGKPAGKPVWPGVWWRKAARVLRGDLKAAGIPYVVGGPDGPLYADFHSLRHSYVTAAVENSPDVKTAQALARHSSPALTIGRYAHAKAGRKRAAVERMATCRRLEGRGEPARETVIDHDRPAAAAGGGETAFVLPFQGAGDSRNDKEAPPGFEPGMVDLQSGAAPRNPAPPGDLGAAAARLEGALEGAPISPALRAYVLELVRREQGRAA
jgi:integrase/recombinase XerD